MRDLNTSQEAKFLAVISDLIEIADDFTQLRKLAEIGDLFYPENDPVHKVLYEKLEKTARHLRGLPVDTRIGHFIPGVGHGK